MTICRHVCEADADVAHGPGAAALQDVCAPRPAEPAVQGDVHVPGGAVPAARSHAHGVRVQQEEHEEEGNDRLVFTRCEHTH